MSLSQIVLIMLSVFSLSLGQIFFKISSPSLEPSLNGIISILLNRTFLLALLIYACATFMWVFVLKSTPLRIAYPFAGLAFFIVPVLSHFILGDRISCNTLLGAGIIAVGIWVSVY